MLNMALSEPEVAKFEVDGQMVAYYIHATFRPSYNPSDKTAKKPFCLSVHHINDINLVTTFNTSGTTIFGVSEGERKMNNKINTNRKLNILGFLGVTTLPFFLLVLLRRWQGVSVEV